MTKPFLTWLTAAAIALPCVSLPSVTLAAAPEPLTLKPSSSWQVNYADDQCRLARQFGEEGQKVLLFMDKYGPSQYFRLTISGAPIKTGVEKADAEIQFGPSEQEQQLSFLGGNLGAQPAWLFSSRSRIAALSAAEAADIKNRPDTAWAEMAPISEERKKAVRYLRVGKPLKTPIILQTGGMRAPLAALDTCVDNLLETWGIDVQKHKSLTREVKPLSSPGNWVAAKNYPIKMLRAGQPAIVEFRMIVGTDGAPASCHIQSSTRPKEFDDAVCGSMMKRARFLPALDADSKAIQSFYRNTVRFELP